MESDPIDSTPDICAEPAEDRAPDICAEPAEDRAPELKKSKRPVARIGTIRPAVGV